MIAGLQNRLEGAIPESFPFYHLGEISLAPAGAEAFGAFDDDAHALGYSLRGDVQGLLVILIERGLDISVYAEAGNCLASRFATELSRREGLDVMISPPHTLTPAALLPLRASLAIERTYLHYHGADIVPVRMLIFSDNHQSTQGQANA